MDATNIAGLVERFHTDGFVEIFDVLDAAMLADLCAVANSNFDEAMQIIEEKSLEFGIGYVHIVINWVFVTTTMGLRCSVYCDLTALCVYT
jgi:hypothetical protein